MGCRGAGAARAEDKPIFLSIGYSACHWCHVMEHESFENPADCAADERALRVHQGRSRRAARPGPDLHERRAVAHGPRRLADVGVSDARFEAVLRRDVLCRPRRGWACRASTRCSPAWPKRWRERRPQALEQADSLTEHLQGAVETQAGSAELTVDLLDNAARTLAQVVRCDARRVWRRAEISAPDGAAVAVAGLAAKSARPAVARGHIHARQNGRGRNLRSARRRVSSLLGRRSLAGAAFRKDAVRQRAADIELPRRVPARRATRSTPGWRGRRATTCCAK